VIVLDACGVGALPDAAGYGDAGADTLGHLAQALGGLELPTLGRLGLGSIVDLAGVPPAGAPVVHGRLRALGPGKDSTAGHWGLMGASVARALPTYPDGFPPEIVEIVTSISGRGVICNRPSNGIEAIEECAAEHVSGGSLIVYTSQDSVLQIAAHVDVVEPTALYSVCTRVREALPPGHAVGRVIARPFTGADGRWQRTDGRRDLSVPPPGRTYLEEPQADGVPVHTVGKGMLVPTVDHGCDPTAPHTDHTREYAPLLAAFDGHRSRRHDGVLADVGASVLAWLSGRGADSLPGESFL
jgi:phosphopentomutase